MADLLSEKLAIKPEELIGEGKFGDFAKAAVLGAGLALSPLHAGEAHELEVAELPADMIASFNQLEENPVLNFSVAQAMADEMITKVGEEAVNEAPEDTEAWGTTKATYEYLNKRDPKIAIAFIGKFNTQAKKLFGNQIRPGINTESIDLPISDKIKIDEVFMQDDRGSVSEEEIAKAIVDKLGATGNVYYLDAARYIASFYIKQPMPKNGMIMWGSRDLRSFVAKQEKDVKSAIGSTRSVMLGNPETKAEWIEKNKQEIKRERAEAEEARRQAYLNSDEYKRSQDPGWTGPNGTWTLGT